MNAGKLPFGADVCYVCHLWKKELSFKKNLAHLDGFQITTKVPHHTAHDGESENVLQQKYFYFEKNFHHFNKTY